MILFIQFINFLLIQGMVSLNATDEVTETEAEEIEKELEETHNEKEKEWKEKEKEEPVAHLTKNQERWFNSLDNGEESER